MLLIAVAVGILAIGFVQLRSAPVDVLPEFTPPYVEVQTEALGLSANEVEQLITVPLEADLLNGVEGVDIIRSESVAGLSDVVMVFKPGTDLYQARQMVQERLIQAHALPQVSKPPTMINPMSSSSRIMMIGIDPNKLSTIEAGVLSHWVIRPRLTGVPGVSNVSIWGLRDQQLQVQVDPTQLADQGVTLNQVVETTGNAQLVSPLTFLEASTPGTGGFIETPSQRLQVRHVFENFGTPEALGNVTVEDTGGQLRIDDVANVVEEHQPLIGDAIVGGNDDRLLLVIEKFPNADTAEVTSGVEDALNNLKPGLTGMKFDMDVFRPATYITDAIGNLRLAIIIGGVLLALVLAAFLFSLRATLISLVTIPLSLMVAALVLYFRGETFNPIAFAGLAVAIAIIVDDAVIGVHNVARRLGERQADDDRSTADVVLEALVEVRRPATYAAFIALLTIVPVVIMQGRPGAFFAPLALSYALAVLASMVVALTVAPALSLLAYYRGSRVHRESPVLRLLNPIYDGALSRLVRAPRAMLIAAIACVVVGLAALPFLNTSLVPSFKDNDVLVNLQGPPGTSEPMMSGITAQLSRELGAIPGVEDVGGHVGRALTGDQIVDVNSSVLSVKIGSDADYDATMEEIRDVVTSLDEPVDREIVTHSQQEVNDVGTLTDAEAPGSGANLDVLTGADKPLVVRVYGQGLDTLRAEADDVRDIVGSVDGVLDPTVETVPEEPVLTIETDLARAEPFGIKPGDVRRASAMLLQGVVVGNIFGEQKVFEVVVKGVPDVRASVENVQNLLIDTPDGGHVRLEQVADVRVQPSPAVIKRDAAQRYIDVEANVSGRSLSAVSADVEDRLADSQFPLEYHAEVVEQTTTAQEIGLGRVVGFGIAVLIAIFLLFQAAFRSWRLAGLAFLTLPVALVGGVLAALIDGATLSLGALIAFLALLGIAARNGVMLIDRFQQLRLDGPQVFGAGLVRRGALERFAPTLTVAVATAAAVLPFVILGNIAGLEILNPMAIVMLGGLITSTLLALFVLPVLYLRFGAGAEPEPVAETPGPSAAEPVAGDREIAAQPAHSRQFERAPGRANTTAYREGEGGSPGRRGE
jgi:CzcA family heavy metal efflux pump